MEVFLGGMVLRISKDASQAKKGKGFIFQAERK